MITITPDARQAIQSLVAPAPEPNEAGVRIAATGNTDGQSTELAIAVVGEPQPGDQVVDEDGARVFLDPAAADLLSDQTLDAQIDTSAKQVNFFLT